MSAGPAKLTHIALYVNFHSNLLVLVPPLLFLIPCVASCRCSEHLGWKFTLVSPWRRTGLPGQFWGIRRSSLQGIGDLTIDQTLSNSDNS